MTSHKDWWCGCIQLVLLMESVVATVMSKVRYVRDGEWERQRWEPVSKTNKRVLVIAVLVDGPRSTSSIYSKSPHGRPRGAPVGPAASENQPFSAAIFPLFRCLRSTRPSPPHCSCRPLISPARRSHNALHHQQ